MSEEAKQKQAEELLQKALSIFGECEPPPDLEEKILRQVRAAKSRRASRWLPALGLAAALLVGVVLIRDWRAVQAPETSVVQLPAPPSPGVNPSIERPRPVEKRASTGSQRRPIRRATPVSKPPIPVEESQISPLPPSELALSVITSSPIEIDELGKETTPLISDLAGADGPGAPAMQEQTTGLEEGREQ